MTDGTIWRSSFFDDKDLVSVMSDSLPKELFKRNDKNVIIVDLNTYPDVDICSDVLYLVEPSTIWNL